MLSEKLRCYEDMSNYSNGKDQNNKDFRCIQNYGHFHYLSNNSDEKIIKNNFYDEIYVFHYFINIALIDLYLESGQYFKMRNKVIESLNVISSRNQIFEAENWNSIKQDITFKSHENNDYFVTYASEEREGLNNLRLSSYLSGIKLEV